VIRVTAASGAYDIHCRWGALDDLGSLMKDAGLSGQAFVISDGQVAPIFAERALRSLTSAGFRTDLFAFAAGEGSKTLQTTSAIYDWLLNQRAERSCSIVALGGGVVGDVAGFAAATYLRGVRFVQAPTSLLAMADASIGGKVGVDHARGKNLIGAFYPPRLVVQDPSALASLPPRSLREGFAEIIKHALIMDAPMLDLLDRDAERYLAVEPELITALVSRNAALKAAVVSEDEREGGRRTFLNYGHTIGHAIEAVAGYGLLLHGEAISIGMMAAAAIGERIGVTPPAVAARQASLFAKYGLPLRHAGLDVDAIVAATALDKKVAARRVRWVLLQDFGRPVVHEYVPDAVIRDVLAGLFA
jgi:3-dehydroquinate synthase